MDLPTYTSIWRIEKRLYKLYDFRLPMPLPIGQVTVFMAIAVPYVVLLTVIGVPFNHTLIWLYVLPPGAATWLGTRPVLENKRLPELIASQLRYLAEPKVWCRMAPLAERDVIIVTARTWQLSKAARRPQTRPVTAPAGKSRPAVAGISQQGPAVAAQPAPGKAAPGKAALGKAALGRPLVHAAARPTVGARGSTSASRPATTTVRAAAPPPRWPNVAPDGTAEGLRVRERAAVRVPAAGSAAASSIRPVQALAAQAHQVPTGPARATDPLPVRQAGASGAGPGARPTRPPAGPSGEPPAGPSGEPPAGPSGEPPAEPSGEPPAERGPSRPHVTIVNAGPPAAPPPAVEIALAGPSARRGDGRIGRVAVVPGGHRPGKPDQLQRDRARAQLPISRPSRVVVLGCTVGAGQTVTALLAGEVLASIRSDQVAVLDLNPGASSLTQRAIDRPALGQAASLAPSRLAILGPPMTAHSTGGEVEFGPDPGSAVTAFELAGAEHWLVLADPSTASVPRLLAIADQLVLVAPASAAAAGAIGLTFEWLEAHGQAGLAAASIMVLNGVSRRSLPHVEQAERVGVGRCRAIVRVPWDDQLKSKAGERIRSAAPAAVPHQVWAGLLSPGTVGAYTALAGVLVSALADLAPSPAQAGR